VDEPVKLSVVVPCFNEQDVIRETHGRLSACLKQLAVAYEIVYVDDGSRDKTFAILADIQRGDPNVRTLRFSRNFGHQIAVSAGLDASTGDAIVIIDADLQDPPELIGEMLAKWQEGYEVVYGQRVQREGETTFKKVTAYVFYRVLNGLSDTPIPRDTGDFRLISRRVADVVRGMDERDRFLRGMISWVGFRQCALPYRRAPRFAGETKYPLIKMIRFANDGIMSFSIQPLRAATWLGMAAAAMAMTGIVYALLVRLLTDFWVSGWTFLIIAILFLGGVQLVVLGVIGEYIGRLYLQAKKRPLYVVDQRLGFPTSDAQPPRSRS